MESGRTAVTSAFALSDRVIVESVHNDDDLRLIVIAYKLVAAAIRRRAEVGGNGRDSVKALIERQSRRRSAATGGESTIPLDPETERCVAKARPEERREGKECVRTGRSRWAPYH